MKVGVVLQQSGRAAGRQALMDAVRRAEALGYDSVWVGDHIVLPWNVSSTYPYGAEGRFPVPPDRPFLEPLSVLAFLAGCTETILLGISVLILPYRHPIYAAKVATTLDHLAEGRFILGVGAGWMAEEFDALGASFHDRGAVSDEQLQVMQRLWREERPRFDGRFYRFPELGFSPKPYRQTGIPVWVGGNGPRAQRRAALYGDAWHPALWNLTPNEVASSFANVRRLAQEAGRDPQEIRLTAWAPVELRLKPPEHPEGGLVGTAEQLTETLKSYEAVGMEHVALNFLGGRLPERLAQWELFAREVLPAFK